MFKLSQIYHVFLCTYPLSSQGVQSKIHVAVERCVAIGLDLPTEPTSGHIVAVVLSIAQANVDPRASFGFVLDFKKG